LITDAKFISKIVCNVKNSITRKNHFIEYVDYSTKSSEWVEDQRRQQSLKTRRTSIAPKGSFPMKLYHMLEHLEAAGFANIISFQPHGRAIRIHLHQRFVNEVLPRYFPDINNIASFLRQLNIYGFRRMIDNGPDHNSYYHAMFLRGRPDLCQLIERPLRGQYSKRKKYDPTTEPKFYTMPPIQLLPEGNDRSNSLLEKEAELSELKKESIEKPRMLERVATEVPKFIQSTAQQHSNAYNDNRKMPPTDRKEFGRSSSFLNDATTEYLLSGERQDFNKNVSSFTLQSDTDNSNSAIAWPREVGEPTGSYGPSTTHYNGNKTIPAEVLAAAESLLTTPSDPLVLNDESFFIVDQYCKSLAINILKQASSQASSEPHNELQRQSQGDAPCDRNNRLQSNTQYADDTDSIISPFSLSAAATDSIEHNTQNELRESTGRSVDTDPESHRGDTSHWYSKKNDQNEH
jgi:hypothetical protein